MAKKPKYVACPVTLKQFEELASPLRVEIANNSQLAEPKTFSSGRFGWYLCGKLAIPLAHFVLPVQINFNLIVMHSNLVARE